MEEKSILKIEAFPQTIVHYERIPVATTPDLVVPKIKTPMANQSPVNEGFSQIQIERFYYLTMYYGETIAMSIVRQVKPHGLNSWTMVCDKISKLTDIEANEQEYHDMIDEKLSIGTKYTNADTIKVVSTVRRSLGMKPYLKDILKHCVKDFLFRHMADVELSVVTEDSNDKPTAIAYIPTINLNSQLNESR